MPLTEHSLLVVNSEGTKTQWTWHVCYCKKKRKKSQVDICLCFPSMFKHNVVVIVTLTAEKLLQQLSGHFCSTGVIPPPIVLNLHWVGPQPAHISYYRPVNLQQQMAALGLGKQRQRFGKDETTRTDCLTWHDMTWTLALPVSRRAACPLHDVLNVWKHW